MLGHVEEYVVSGWQDMGGCPEPTRWEDRDFSIVYAYSITILMNKAFTMFYSSYIDICISCTILNILVKKGFTGDISFHSFIMFTLL